MKPFSDYLCSPVFSLFSLLATPTVGCLPSSVCLTVCPEHNSKTNDPKVFKLGTGNIHRSGMVWGWKVKGQGTGSINAFFTPMTITPMLMTTMNAMSIECLYSRYQFCSMRNTKTTRLYLLAFLCTYVMHFIYCIVLYAIYHCARCCRVILRIEQKARKKT